MRVTFAAGALRTCLLTVLLGAGSTAAHAQRIQAPPVKQQPTSVRVRTGFPTRMPAAITLSSLAERPETEPNDSMGAANVVVFGDEILGTMGTPDDIDWFAIDLQAGVVIEAEVFAQRNGSALDSYMVLIAPDRATTVATNDDLAPGEILDSRIRTVIPATGRYYIGLLDYYCAADLPQCNGGPTYSYRLKVSAGTAAPGDPTTRIASNLGSPWGAAAAPNGDVFIADQDGRVLRMTSTGTVSVYATNIGTPFDVVIDATGDLLVAGELTATTSGVTRIKPDGTRSTFVTGLAAARAITVGPDGDVWVGNPTSRRLHRYGFDGTVKTAVDVPTLNTSLIDIAFSPTGVLHVADYATGVFRLVNNALVRLITYTSGQPAGLAFDRDGYLYMGTASNGVRLYDPNGTLVFGPFAEFSLDLPGNLVFGRDAAGAMTTRLYAINYGAASGSVSVLNPAGVRAPGFRVGIDLLLFAQDSILPGVMGAPYSFPLRLLNSTGPVAWTIDSGSLPPGLRVDVSTGTISGVPEASGRFTFVVRANGSNGRFGTRSVSIDIARPVVAMSDAANHLLGVTGALSADLLRFLDLQGNKNGRFDAGDLQTYLRSGGRTP